jgi:NAD(P)-dependent dehydrogenase (short-subunit alcohol dehydrogenase family)
MHALEDDVVALFFNPCAQVWIKGEAVRAGVIEKLQYFDFFTAVDRLLVCQRAVFDAVFRLGRVAGIRGLPGAEAYSASKAAVISYCESLRLELKQHGIRVVTICPGYIDTPMTQINPYPMPFLMPVQKFAVQAARTIASGSSYRVIPWQMGIVAKVLRMLPNWLYDLAFGKAPHKPRQHNPSNKDGA